jgi:S1-C subfamily serine protease
MKKANIVKLTIIALCLASFTANAVVPENKTAVTPYEIAAKNRKLVGKYSDSIAVVRYYVKKNDKGVEPSFRIPYKCPNCDNIHFRDGLVSAVKKIPAEFAGFLISDDRVLMTDIMLPPEFIDRIEVECAGEVVAAEEYESSRERKALYLKLARPFSRAKPIRFVDDKNPENPSYFFMVREEGMTVAGVSESKISQFKHFVELDKDVYEDNPNTLVVNKALEPVTVALEDKIELGKEVFSSPLNWPREPADKRFERIRSLETKLIKSIIPINIQLEAKAKESKSRFSISWNNDNDLNNKNDIDCPGIVIDGGKVIVLAALQPQATARLVNMNTVTSDGKKIPLQFLGSYQDEGAFLASVPTENIADFEPLKLEGRKAIELWQDEFYQVYFLNVGGRIEFNTGLSKVYGFRRIEGNVSVAEFEKVSGAEARFSSSREYKNYCIFALDGSLVAVNLKSRHSERWSSDGLDILGEKLANMIASPKFDSENIPRKFSDRKRVAYFGVEVQSAGLEMAREKKAVGYLKTSPESAPLVTEVYPNSPADKLGVKAGDILVSIKHVSASRKEDFSVGRDYMSEINWGEAFEYNRFAEYASMGQLAPWSSIESGIKSVVSKFNVGAKVSVSWVSNGELKEGETTLALAPVQFTTAVRVRNKELSIAVCDMTQEVRKYFKFDDKAPGVVIAKIKSGGVGAVAGLKPLELIVEVNGEGVVSAKDFQEKTKGKKELNFTVRRLSNTRVVPIKL